MYQSSIRYQVREVAGEAFQVAKKKMKRKKEKKLNIVLATQL